MSSRIIPPQQREFIYTMQILFAGLFFFSIFYVIISGISTIIGEPDSVLILGTTVFLVLILTAPIAIRR